MKHFTAPSIEELQPKFPSHHIQSFIAQGGMGAVYLATQISLDRPVAIKILPREFGADEEYRTSFTTDDFGDVDGMLFIIMEYIPGRSLYTVANGVAVEQLEAANLISEMCRGLAHAHTAGMLHRDIKPANVLIDDEAQPKIVDFGLVRPLGEYQTEGEVFGTPGYTAPELLNDPLNVDQRSDIFSMGVMLYELLTAKLPEEPFVTASDFSDTDKRFDHIIAKAINPDPNLRYHTAGQMAAALDDLIKSFSEAPGGLRKAVPQPALNTVLGATPATGALALNTSEPITTGLASAVLRAGPRTTNTLGSTTLGSNTAGLEPTELSSSSTLSSSTPSPSSEGNSKAGLVVCFVLLLIAALAVYAMGGLDQFDSKEDVNSADSVADSEKVADEGREGVKEVITPTEGTGSE